MLKGIHLTLMMGPAVPAPVPFDVIEALTSVEVQTNTQGASGFQLEFRLSNRSKLHTLFLLIAGAVPQVIRVVIVVTLNGTPTVLIDGVMTSHQMSPGADGRSRLTVSGVDLTALMGHEDFSGLPFPALPVFLRVRAILAKYAAFGVTAKVIPNLSMFTANPLDRIPIQRGTDLEYIQEMAARSGYVFYLDAGPTPGRSVAYWGPLIKSGPVQSALSTNLDASTNVESLSVEFNNEQAETPVVKVQEPFTKAVLSIPVGDIAQLNSPLGRAIPTAQRIVRLKHTAKLSFLEAIEAGLAHKSQQADCLSAQGSLDVTRYGRILEARKLVGVRGLGGAFDGTYYVEGVTHRLKPGEYKQDFRLSRNGLFSTSERLPA